MKIIYLGNNERGKTCLKALNKEHNIVYTIASKGEDGWFSSIKPIAEELGIECSTESIKELIEKLRSLNPDLGVMCGYPKIVNKEFIEIPRYGCINLHASKLPDYRGASPLSWALINGEKEIGLSIYQVDEGIDTGDILAQHTFGINLETTIKDVLDETLREYPRMLLEVCEQIEKGTTTPIKQDLKKGRYFTRRYHRDGEIKWDSMTDMQVYNLVRALTHPYPGAFFTVEESTEECAVYKKKNLVWKAKLVEEDYHGIPGRIAHKDKEGTIIIAKNRGIKLIGLEEKGNKKKKENPILNKFFKLGDKNDKDSEYKHSV